MAFVACPIGFKLIFLPSLSRYVACPTLHHVLPARLPVTSDEEQLKALNEINDQKGIVRDSVHQARTLCTTTVSSFLQALANALPQYAANGITDFSADPWWVSMTSYFKASLWLFAAVPGVPMRHLADEDGDGSGSGKQRILDANEVEVLAMSAGCQEYVEVSKHLWWVDSCFLAHCTPERTQPPIIRSADQKLCEVSRCLELARHLSEYRSVSLTQAQHDAFLV